MSKIISPGLDIGHAAGNVFEPRFRRPSRHQLDQIPEDAEPRFERQRCKILWDRRLVLCDGPGRLDSFRGE